MNAAVQPFLVGSFPWTEVRDGHPAALALFSRHYSRYAYADGRQPRRFVGPGERMVLMTPDVRALFVWRKFKSMDDQDGVNCSIFRNEGPHLSSDLIRSAMVLAWKRWPGARLYTYVNQRKVRSANPGYCFIRAGWSRCGITKKRRLWVLEVLPQHQAETVSTIPARAQTEVDALNHEVYRRKKEQD